MSRNLVYVDAITGDILDTESKIHHVNSPGTADTRYSWARNIITDSFAGGFRMREIRNNNVRIETYNMRNQGTNYSGAPDFVDNNNSWTATEFNNANMDNAALDAHWGTEIVYDYFNTVHGRNSWNGSGGPLLNYVHTNLVAFGYPDNVNAFWDGQRMTYGDGNDCFDPLTSLDVSAHEIGHGINSSSARMKYEGESGALNEALSDIWAACVELWAAPEKETWLLGEDITQCDDAFRSMSNPNDHEQPDTYQSPLPSEEGFWWPTDDCSRDNCGVHTNSGVPNFWFFLLVNGGTDTNDIGNCYNVTGIGIDHAARIVYRAETVILASGSEQIVTFNQFRNATITAASNWYGANSPEVISVTNAWYAVGVGDEYQYQISGPSVVCPSGTTFTISNPPAFDSIVWTCGPYLSVSSGQNTDSCTFVVTGTGNSSINAQIYSICGNSHLLQTPVLVYSAPTEFGVSSFNNLEMITGTTFRILPSLDAYRYRGSLTVSGTPNSSYRWTQTSSYPNDIGWSANGATVDVYTRFENKNLGLTCTETNNCTSSYRAFVFTTNDLIEPPISIFPNPATEGTTIFIESSNVATKDISNAEWDLEIYDQSQQLKMKKAKLKGNEFKLNTSGWKEGVYIVRAIIGDKILNEKLLVKH